MTLEPRPCAVCGAEFTPGNVRAVVCSRECKLVAEAARRRDRRAFIEHGRQAGDPGRVDAVIRRAQRDREQARDLRRDELAARLAARERAVFERWRERDR